MRLLGVFLTLCIALAALKAAVTLTVIVVIGGMLFSLATKPAETLGFVLMFALIGLLGQHPLAVGAPLAALAVIGWLAERKRPDR